MQETGHFSDLCISKVHFVNTYSFEAIHYPMRNKGRYRHALMYTIEGTETYLCGHQQVSSEPNSVIYLPKNASYTIQLAGDKSTVIIIDFELTSDSFLPPFGLKVSNANTLKAEFTEVEKKWQRKEPGCELFCKSLLYKAMSMIEKQESVYHSPKSYARITDAVEYLHKHYTDSDFKIETLFHIADVSPYYFEKLFFEHFHSTPKEYVTAMKMERAKGLLASGLLSVGNIAEQLGYNDIYHFSKVFKAKTGYSPSEFRHADKSIKSYPSS